MVTPGQRVDLIRECATLLEGRDWDEIDLILKSFKLPTSDYAPNGQRSYVMQMVQDEPDNALVDLHGYLTGKAGGPAGPEPWTRGRLKLFASHLVEHREFVGNIGNYLAGYGVHTFVAHDSITPSMEWRNVIEAALQTCDAMAVFLHPGFRESEWCDQEVGWALGQRIPALPLTFGIDPYGFLGKFQAERCEAQNLTIVGSKVMSWLLRTKSTHTALAEGLVWAFENSNSFNRTRSLVPALEQIRSYTPDQLTRIEKATRDNNQIAEAFIVSDSHTRESAPKRIARLLEDRGATTPSPVDDPWTTEPPF